jgi:hypothetical protein
MSFANRWSSIWLRRPQKEKPPLMISVGSCGGFGGDPALDGSVNDRKRQVPAAKML